MKHAKFLPSLSMALALMLICAALPLGALAAETDFVELVATDITLDQTHFEYTGEEIRPNVTVRVNDTLLTLDKDYLLEYKNNIEVGEAAVVVTGIATSGYMGTVEHPFYIDPKTTEDDEQNLITILEILRDSFVWVPCNVVMSEADQQRIEEMVLGMKDNLDALIGQELVTNDITRFIPDILQNGEDFFFPILRNIVQKSNFFF